MVLIMFQRRGAMTKKRGALRSLQITFSLLYCCLSVFLLKWSIYRMTERSKPGLSNLGNLKTQPSFTAFPVLDYLSIHQELTNMQIKWKKTPLLSSSLWSKEQSETQLRIWYLFFKLLWYNFERCAQKWLLKI